MAPVPPVIPKETIQRLALPLLAPDGPFSIGFNERGRYFTKSPKTLLHFYVNRFAEFADNTFIVYKDERYTFQQVWNISRDLGVLLKKKYNIKQGDRVAISMRNNPEWCFSFLACGTIGAIPVPLNSFWKGKEMCYGLKDSGSRILICDYERYSVLDSFLDQLNIPLIVVRAPYSARNLKGAIRFKDLLQQVDISMRPNDDSLIQLADSIDIHDAGTILYTSGTTGNPKGVVLTHLGILTQMTNSEFLSAVQEKIQSLPEVPKLMDNQYQECILCVVPLFHGTGSHHNFLRSIVIGQKLVLMFKWDPEIALQLIEKERVTTWSGVPTMALDIIEHPSFEKYDTSSLLRIGAGGAPTPESQVKRTAERFKNGLPTTAYGLTETNGAICMNSTMNYIRKPTSCGVPFPVVEVKIVDIQSGKVLGPNQRGELLIKSNLVMKEYWNKPEATAKVLTEDGFFRSGDIATIDEDGFIYIVDRAKDIIIRGGENISCTEVEHCIYSHPNVRECAVFGIPDKRLGEEVGALILLRDKSSCSSEEIVKFLKGKLASFKIPRTHNIFFTTTPLPRGSTGKIMKRTIKEKILASNVRSKL